MRKLFLLFWALLATTSLWAHDFEVDGIYYNYLDGNNVEVTDDGNDYYKEYSGAVTIPASITYNGTTYSVTSIGDHAFESSLYLTSITIPSSVTSIGESAFGNCSRLSSITIPNSVTSMGDYVFARCDSLAFVSIGDGVKSIGIMAFFECYSLKNVYIGNSVTSIGNFAFYNCSKLSSITIPNSVTSIGEYAFYNCSKLSSITIPNSVTSIGEYAFYKCSSLASVDLGNGVISIGTKAFNYCSTLSYITIPNSVKSIGSWAFSECSSLKYASIGSGVSSIPEYAFYNCYKLFYLTISNSVTSIGKKAFAWCSSLTDITIPNSVTSIGDEAFIWCEALNSVSIGNSIKSIGSSAFAWCKAINSIACFAMTPPVLGNDVFKKCDNAKLFVLCEALPNYRAHEQFEQFTNIECIGSEKVEIEDVVIESGTNDVTITWPVEMEADTYTIVIKNINEVCCTLNFNADGQLLNIAFAPSRDGNHRHAQYAEQIANGGFRFTLTGLEEGTNYTYDIIVKDQQDKELSTYSGEFTTKSNVTTDMDNIQSPVTTCQKIFRNGQLVIVRDGVEYNAQGQIVKE